MAVVLDDRYVRRCAVRVVSSSALIYYRGDSDGASRIASSQSSQILLRDMRSSQAIVMLQILILLST